MSGQSITRIFAKKLLEWWKNNKREFPWRKTHDSYEILVSEILLHRTRADQVETVYVRFIERFPTILALSEASIDDVKNILFPLGLHWRTEQLYKMAGEIVQRYNCEVPSETKDLEALPGVGRYIAAAVRCFSHGYPEALLDTNTVRILGRFFGIEKTDSSRRSKRFRELYEPLVDQEHPREFNYAMIDLGALVCKAKNPICDICPINKKCKCRFEKTCENNPTRNF